LISTSLTFSPLSISSPSLSPPHPAQLFSWPDPITGWEVISPGKHKGANNREAFGQRVSRMRHWLIRAETATGRELRNIQFQLDVYRFQNPIASLVAYADTLY